MLPEQLRRPPQSPLSVIADRKPLFHHRNNIPPSSPLQVSTSWRGEVNYHDDEIIVRGGEADAEVFVQRCREMPAAIRTAEANRSPRSAMTGDVLARCGSTRRKNLANKVDVRVFARRDTALDLEGGVCRQSADPAVF